MNESDDLLAVPGNRKLAEATILARSFHHLAGAGLAAYVHGDDAVWQSVTPVVAFAVELYLKIIGAATAGVWHRGHDLRGLFDRLHPDTREDLERRYSDLTSGLDRRRLDAKMIPDASTLSVVLTRSRDAFAELRYSFESAETAERQLPDGFGLLWTAEILAQYVHALPAPRAGA